jgi:hypothetical protein
VTDLYSKASLILTANAFSASKAYAIKPSDGTGDFSFSRSTVSGSRITSNGSIQFVNANVPRLTYLTTSSSPSFLLEPQRTNSLIQSNGFNTTWGLVNTLVTASQATSPEVILNGWKLNEIQDIQPAQSSTIFTNFSASVTTLGGTVEAATCISSSIAAILAITTNTPFVIRQTSALSATANSRYICSAYVKPAERTRIAFQSNLTGDSNYLLTKFNLTGTGSVYSTPAGYTGSISLQTNGWYRISTAATADSTTTKYFSIDLLSGSAFDNEYLGSSNTGVFIYGAQIEAGSYSTTTTASSYIPTTTTTATRNADVLSNTGMQSLGFVNSKTWTIFIDYNIDNPVAFGGVFLTLKDQSDNILLYLVKTSTGIRGIDYKNSNATIFSSFTSPNASKIALTSDGATIRVYVNGQDTSTAYTPSNSDALSIDRMSFDAADSVILGNPSLSALIKNVIVYPTALSAVECGYLTTITT